MHEPERNWLTWVIATSFDHPILRLDVKAERSKRGAWCFRSEALLVIGGVYDLMVLHKTLDEPEWPHELLGYSRFRRAEVTLDDISEVLPSACGRWFSRKKEDCQLYVDGYDDVSSSHFLALQHLQAFKGVVAGAYPPDEDEYVRRMFVDAHEYLRHLIDEKTRSYLPLFESLPN